MDNSEALQLETGDHLRIIRENVVDDDLSDYEDMVIVRHLEEEDGIPRIHVHAWYTGNEVGIIKYATEVWIYPIEVELANPKMKTINPFLQNLRALCNVEQPTV